MADGVADSQSGTDRLVIAGDADGEAACTAAATSPAAGTATIGQRPSTAGPAASTQPAGQNVPSPGSNGSKAARDLQNTTASASTQLTSAADTPWRARAAWLQSQTNGDPAAELYKSSIPLGRAAGMGGVGPDSSAYQDSYGKDAAGLAKSTAKEAVARKAQVRPDRPLQDPSKSAECMSLGLRCRPSAWWKHCSYSLRLGCAASLLWLSRNGNIM